MIGSTALYEKTLNLCELTEKAIQVSALRTETRSFSTDLSHCLIEDSVLLRSCIHQAIYESKSIKNQYAVIRFALVLVRNLQSYLRGLAYDNTLPQDYSTLLTKELKGYSLMLRKSYRKWRVYLN